MRSAIVAAAFAAGAIAVPYNKRDVVYDYDYVTVTDVVTVTGGAPSSTSVAAATTNGHWGHHNWSKWSPVQSSTAAPAPSSYSAPSSSETPATSAAPTTSTYVAPPPISTSTSTSTYVAPTTSQAPSSTSAAPSSTAPATSAASSAASSAAPTSYSEKVVAHHNIHRANHSAPDIEWSDSLASIAADIAASCSYAHNVDAEGGGYGQNIAAGVEADNITAIITDLFYNGEVGWFADLYGEAQPDMTNFEHWGHFSQIVWKGTTQVGCATQDCTSQGLANVGSDVAPYFTVCNYKSPGNYANEYGDNVGSPLGEATAQWNTGL